MKRKLVIGLAAVVGVIVTALLVAASIWPVINVVETGKTPQYPDVQPQYYTADPRRVFDESQAGVKSLDSWTLVSTDSSTRTLTGKRTSPILGLVDEVTIRVEPMTEFVTVVRLKSASRIGKGDFGQNARNIGTFFAELDRRLGAVKFDPDELRHGGDASQDEESPSAKTSPDKQPDAGPPLE